MSWYDAIGTATSAAAESSSGWFDSIGNFATDAFGWIQDNPEAAKMIGGVAMGVGQGYMQMKQAEDQREFEMDMYKRQREDSFAKPGEISAEDYNNYGANISSGLISNGMITGG